MSRRQDTSNQQRSRVLHCCFSSAALTKPREGLADPSCPDGVVWASHGSFFGGELKRIEVRVLEFDPKPRRLAGELADIRAGLPGNNSVQFVAELQVSVGKCEAGDRLAFRVLKLAANAVRGGCRKVDTQPIPFKPQRLGDQFTAARRSRGGDKTVNAKRVAPQPVAIRLVHIVRIILCPLCIGSWLLSWDFRGICFGHQFAQARGWRRRTWCFRPGIRAARRPARRTPGGHRTPPVAADDSAVAVAGAQSEHRGHAVAAMPPLPRFAVHAAAGAAPMT